MCIDEIDSNSNKQKLNFQKVNFLQHGLELQKLILENKSIFSATNPETVDERHFFGNISGVHTFRFYAEVHTT